MTPNFALIDKVIDQIEQEPDRWDQSAWRYDSTAPVGVPNAQGGRDLVVDCNTAFCFAGWAATLSGGNWADTAYLWAEADDPAEDRNPAGWVLASIRAERLLGVDWDTADRLFLANNSLDDIKAIVAELKEASLVHADTGEDQT